MNTYSCYVHTFLSWCSLDNVFLLFQHAEALIQGGRLTEIKQEDVNVYRHYIRSKITISSVSPTYYDAKCQCCGGELVEYPAVCILCKRRVHKECCRLRFCKFCAWADTPTALYHSTLDLTTVFALFIFDTSTNSNFFAPNNGDLSWNRNHLKHRHTLKGRIWYSPHIRYRVE